MPEPLIDKLVPGGRLIIPVERRPRAPMARDFNLGSLWFGPQQDALVGTKNVKGKAAEEQILPVAFVPLIADEGGREA